MLEMPARVGFWALIGGYRYMDIWPYSSQLMCHGFEPHKFSIQHLSHESAVLTLHEVGLSH